MKNLGGEVGTALKMFQNASKMVKWCPTHSYLAADLNKFNQTLAAQCEEVPNKKWDHLF